MDVFQAKSLEIAQTAAEAARASADASVVSGIIAVIALVVSAVAGFLIWQQLRSARWLALLSFEQDMYGRARAFQVIAQQLNQPNPPAGIATVYAVEKEAYLNAVDRLASSILNGQFPEKEMRQDYRDYIRNVIQANPAEYATGTSYRKTVRLHEKWQDR